MTKDQVNKLLSAMETAEIDKFSVVDDIFVRYYNDGVCGIIKPDTSNELFVCIAANNQGGSHKAFGSNLTVTSVDFTDMHEFVVGGDYEKISNFVEALGVEFLATISSSIADLTFSISFRSTPWIELSIPRIQSSSETDQ